MYHCFISDLHLYQNSDSDTLFNKFINDYKDKLLSLYILGDFFEYWIGDDTASEYHQNVADKINHLKQFIPHIYFMHGNRDFLIGNYFLNTANLSLLPDPFVLNINNSQFLLSHGDSLCTFDKNYQLFRKVARNKVIKNLFLSLPKSFRYKVATELRKEKEKPIQTNNNIFDVNDNFAKKMLSDYKCTTLIHGHTHKPKTHEYEGKTKRIVLGDWHQSAEILLIDSNASSKLIKYY
ncbi:MAG: UDP-2,3-diacylglucosamine diphosphatase [Francisellaceae bacterium]|nr:UDP-2,3-diacylglucosamine diphosphatase [Francisellaceae bacterium]